MKELEDQCATTIPVEHTVKQLIFCLRKTEQFDKDTWLLRNSAKNLRISSEFLSSESKVARENITMKGPETIENTQLKN